MISKGHSAKPPAGGIAFPAAPVRRKARQAHTFLEARGGAQVRFAGDGPLVEGGAAPLLKQQQTGACKARPADEENNVAGLCLAAQERLFRLSEHSQAEVELVGAGEVASQVTVSLPPCSGSFL